jgi:flagellar hook protein FlgE
MSLFGALDTAVSGLGAQAAAFTNISDDVANAQTIGFKRVDTNFIDYLTYSTPTVNISGSVATTPQYVNDVQGTLSQSQDTLAMAIGGQGFFNVSKATAVTSSTTSTSGSSQGSTTFSPTSYYTRTGDFTLNEQGYMVNSAGEYLNGWTVDSATGAVSTGTVSPIQISQDPDPPVATSSLTLSANLPASPSTNPVTSTLEVYDSTGTLHTVTLTWTQASTNNWTVSATIPDDTSGTYTSGSGSATVQFGPSSYTGSFSPADGTISSLSSATGLTASSYSTASSPATLTITPTLAGVTQTIALNFGDYGTAEGVTQYAGTTYDQTGVSQNGYAAGAFSGVSTTTTGDIVINYDNGQSATVYQVPIATFYSPDNLTRQNGQSFTANNLSGTALLSAPGTNAAGSLVTGSVENSNVDIATEFTSLIVAQQAYSANAKVVTSANQLMTTTLDMKQ